MLQAFLVEQAVVEEASDKVLRRFAERMSKAESDSKV